VPCTRRDLERVCCLQHERVVARDNTASFARLSLQVERQRWRGTLAGCRVIVYEHLDGWASERTWLDATVRKAHHSRQRRARMKRRISLRRPDGALLKLSTGHLMCYKMRTSSSATNRAVKRAYG